MSHDEKKVAIAVHVLGWEPETRKMYAGEKNVKGWGYNTHLERGDRNRRFAQHPFNLPDPLTDPAALGEVKERFAGWHWNVDYDEDGYSVMIWGRGEDLRSYSATAPTEAEAFMIAALRASGMEVEV